MKIQCNVCERGEANVLCCADEAALCWSCDDKVHAANKLASKHQRLVLSTSSHPMPKCDICQDTIGYIFCLEDRALFCRKCDISIHTANSRVSGHQRFLLTGVKVELEATEPVGSSTKGKSTLIEKTAEKASLSIRSSSLSVNHERKEVLSHQVVARTEAGPVPKLSFSGSTTTESIPGWPFDDILGLSDFDNNYEFMEHGSYKAESGKLGDSDCSLLPQVANEDFVIGNYSAEVPELQWIVPEIPSPPTASGLFWPKTFRNSPSNNTVSPSNNTVFVPDVCYSPQNFHQYQPDAAISKRQRRY